MEKEKSPWTLVHIDKAILHQDRRKFAIEALCGVSC